MHNVLQLLLQHMHKWSIICITSLSINIFAQLLSHFYSRNCSTHRVPAASEGVAMSVQKNWYIINISKLSWRKVCKTNRWVFQTSWLMKLKKGIAISSAIRLRRWPTNCVHEILLTHCNANYLRQVKFWDIDAQCPENNALVAVHAQMEYYLHYIVDYQYFCTFIES